MISENIIILGPTSSGKTDLANFFAKKLSLPVFNCDSVQVYKDLDYLSNKPIFQNQLLDNNELISLINNSEELDIEKYRYFDFKVIQKKDSVVESHNFDINELLNFFEKYILNLTKEEPIKNFLFDIRKPLEAYSVADFTEDVKRISSKFKLKSKILTGGTVFYGYHYILGTKFDTEQFSNDKESYENIDELVSFLKQNDNEYLQQVDQNNIARLSRAVQYIKKSGKKFSEFYDKKQEVLDDFILILIYPKNREEYVKRLDKIVKDRINDAAVSEVEKLIKTYDVGVESWLEKISYEYKYCLKIKKLFDIGLTLESSEISNVINELQAKERQYTKRQVTFMRKLEKELFV